MHVTPIDSSSRKEVNAFLELPFRIYADCPQWVPPLMMNARRWFNREQNPYYRHSEAAFFLARSDDGDVIGRLAVLDHANHNAYHHSRTAFFYLFECIHHQEAAHQLFNAGYEWARARGLDQIVGPRGFSAMDGAGLLVEGFEHRPAFGIPYNLPFYRELIEAEGFQLQRDMLSGYLDRRVEFPERVHRVAQKVAERRGLHIARFKNRRDLRRIVPQIRSLYNAALADMPDNAPLTEDEADAIAQQMIWFADPSIIKIVRKDDQPVGFIFAYPDISAAVQRNRGRLFPFGWLDILIELRRTRWVNLNGAGIIAEQRGLGSTAILISEIAHDLLQSRYDYADFVQIRADNDKMLREVSRFGIDFYKRHRLYRKSLV
jgi:GNAT superfamily N-acetyltransferase